MNKTTNNIDIDLNITISFNLPALIVNIYFVFLNHKYILSTNTILISSSMKNIF